MSYRNGLEILREHQANPKLSTGNLGLDSLLAGGVENGTFSLIYGDDENVINQILYTLLCNCQLPIEKHGLNGKAVLLSCGGYNEEQALLDLKLTTSLLRANGIDPTKGLDEIIAISAFNTDHAVKSVEDIVNVVRYHDQVRLVVIRNLPKLFVADGSRNELSLERTQQLQHLLAKLWQACSERKVTLITSCRPRRPFSISPSPPEGGTFLRHMAQVILCFKKKQDNNLTAFLLKHPKRQPGSTEFQLNQSESAMGSLTDPFRNQLQHEIENLTKSFKEALMEPAHRDTFDSLVRAWTVEQETMSYANVPSVLKIMLLMAAVDNRKIIEDLQDQVAVLRSQLRKNQSSNAFIALPD